jgi:hypothetical protein
MLALLRRMRYAAEGALGRLPMMILSPVIGAIAGTWWQLERSSEVIRHGLVVGVPSTPDVLAGTIIGALGGIVVGLSLAFVWAGVSYFARGDRVWETLYTGSVEGMMFFQLSCKAGIVADPSHLGAIECLLRKPSGELVTYNGPLMPRHNPYGVTARFQMEPEVGIYKCRWSATREDERLHEIARGKFEVMT